MKLRRYDKRMRVWDNWRYGVWRPLLCSVFGHNVECYAITPFRGIITGYVYICHRCVEMEDHDEPCGQCEQGCKDNDDPGDGGLRVEYTR